MKKLIVPIAVLTLTIAGCSSSSVETYVGNSVSEDTTTYVTYTKDGEDITDIKFDAASADFDSKVAYSESGEYGLEAASPTGQAWHTQVASLEDYIVANDAFPTTDAEGNDADAVTSATIGLTEFENAFNSSVEESTVEGSTEYKNLLAE